MPQINGIVTCKNSRMLCSDKTWQQHCCRVVKQ